MILCLGMAVAVSHQALASDASNGAAVDRSDGWSTQRLMHMLGEVEAAELTFVEQRTSAFLVDEIELTGSMSYRAPDRIEKHVETPFVEKIRIAGDLLTIEKVSDRGESSLKTYSLQSLDSIGTAVEGIRATLSGNLDSLNSNYDVEMSGDVEAWQVLLVPLRAEVREIIERISVSGSDSMIRVIETQDADGDESTLTLSYQMIR